MLGKVLQACTSKNVAAVTDLAIVNVYTVGIIEKYGTVVVE